MKYRRLGKTGMNVSVVGIGTWQFGGEWGMDFTQAEADAILDKGAELGINLIDTAECYGDHLSESLIGDYISRRKREDWIIATKFGHHFPEPFKRTSLFSAADVVSQLDASLKALQTDYVDLYQFHSGPDEVFDNDALWTALRQAGAGGQGAASGHIHRQQRQSPSDERLLAVRLPGDPGRLQPPRPQAGGESLSFLHGAGFGRACPSAARKRLPERQVQARDAVRFHGRAASSRMRRRYAASSRRSSGLPLRKCRSTPTWPLGHWHGACAIRR